MLPTKGICRLSLEADLNYINYDVSDNSNNHLSANSFTQRYSLTYQKAGNIIDKKFGKYDVTLGYDWSTFDTTIKSTDSVLNPQGSRGRILYKGDIIVDPKEIPLRFTAYSRDMGRSSFNRDLFLSGNDSLLVNPGVATGILTGGTHIDSGATLVMGVKNGMTNGYNEMLRHFPMLMLDYQDVINRDLSGLFPVDNRSSRLAFVSLNKKDNWFHYRILSYEDYIDPANNSKETQFQLGTIDQSMQRRWIDFANWIQVSADAQLTKRAAGTSANTTELTNLYSSSPGKTTEFNLNLFAVAQRSNWEARTFNNFIRANDGNGVITYQTATPVYASGSWSADTSWNTRFTYKEIHDNRNNQFTDISGGYRVNTFKRSYFTLNQGLDLEKASSNSTDMFAISGSLETASTSRFSRTVTLAATYNIQNSSNTSNTGTSNFLNQTFTANATYTPSNEMRFTLQQTNQITRGTSKQLTSPLNGAIVSTPQYIAPSSISSASDSTFSSTTAISAMWNPLPRLNIGFTASENIIAPKNSPGVTLTSFSNTINYSGNNFRLASSNSLTIDNREQGANTTLFSSNNNADFTFNRNVDSRINVTYNKTLDNLSQSDALSIEEHLNYSYYRGGGFTRKLLEITETANYSENSGSSNNVTTRSSSSNLSLGAKYYPIRQLVLGAGAKYSFINGFNYSTASYYASLGLNIKLLQASLDYTYGTNKSDGRIEKKFTANVRKSF